MERGQCPLSTLFIFCIEGSAMTSKLMSTSIVTDSNKDQLAAVDVYTQRAATTPLNRIKQATPDIENTFSPIKNSSILADIKKIKTAPDVVGRITSIDALYSRLGELNSGLKGSLSNLDNASIDTLMEALGGDPDSKLAKVVIGANTFSNMKTKTTGSFAKLIAGILGDSAIMKYFDLEAEGSLLSVLIGNALQLGLGDLVDKLIARASDEKLKKRLMEENLLLAVMSSDIKTVKKIVNELGVPKCLAKQPTIVYDLISYYRYDKDAKNIKINELREEMEELLARFDTKWDLQAVNGVDQPSFRNTYNASNDFKTLYPSRLRPGVNPGTTVEYERRALLMMNAKLLRKTEMYTLVRRQYRSVILMNG